MTRGAASRYSAADANRLLKEKFAQEFDMKPLYEVLRHTGKVCKECRGCLHILPLSGYKRFALRCQNDECRAWCSLQGMIVAEGFVGGRQAYKLAY